MCLIFIYSSHHCIVKISGIFMTFCSNASFICWSDRMLIRTVYKFSSYLNSDDGKRENLSLVYMYTSHWIWAIVTSIDINLHCIINVRDIDIIIIIIIRTLMLYLNISFLFQKRRRKKCMTIWKSRYKSVFIINSLHICY